MAALPLHKKLATYQLFKDFTPEDIQRILHSSPVRALDAGEVLIGPGQANNTLFLLIEGELSVILAGDEGEIAFPIQVGECLGEMSLIMARPTSALAKAKRPSRVLCIPEKCFWGRIGLTRQGVRNLMDIMAGRLRRSNQSLMKEVMEQLKYQHLQKELETAGKIQASMVPNGAQLLLNRPDVDAYALINQARVVGGDFYDALMLDDDRLYFAIGDVSGKGMPAALLMMRTVTSLRLLAGNDLSFKNVIPAVNDMLAKNNEDMMFVTIFAGVLHLRSGVLQYVSGGHNPPFISLGGNPFQPMELPTGTLVGVEPEVDFAISELQLQSGDTLLLYTDGITEAMNRQEVMFGTKQTGRVINERPFSSMKDLVQHLEMTVQTYVGSAPQHDDLTVLGLRYLGPAA